MDDAIHYLLKCINTLNHSGLPSHKLIFKIEASVMLLKNFNPPKLCNGTGLKVKAKNITESIVITECAREDIVFIPRIMLIPTNYPFEFVITINRSQGQSLSIALT